jgi:DNA-binding NarL/FixJ family response regulator
VNDEIRVLVADDHAVMRDTIACLIDSQPGMRVIGTASNAREAADLTLELLPDVAILDVNMPEGGGWDAARAIRAAAPDLRMVAYSAHDRGLLRRSLKACGISAYVRKDTDTSALLAAIRGEAVAEDAPAALTFGDRTLSRADGGSPKS